jgi:hypothetical protein
MPSTNMDAVEFVLVLGKRCISLDGDSFDFRMVFEVNVLRCLRGTGLVIRASGCSFRFVVRFIAVGFLIVSDDCSSGCGCTGSDEAAN